MKLKNIEKNSTYDEIKKIPGARPWGGIFTRHYFR